MRKMCLVVLVVFYLCSVVVAGDMIRLPEPAKSGGVTLLQALSQRQSSRSFLDTDLTMQQLSDLLWASAGVNRSDGRTVYPTAMNRQDMTVFVINRQGVYRYLPGSHGLECIREGDFRAKTGGQPFVGAAAVNLAYVQNVGLWNESPERYEKGKDWGFAHAGEITQNAGLFAAGQGWANVVRGMFDQGVMKELLGLGGDEFVRLVHSIGPGK